MATPVKDLSRQTGGHDLRAVRDVRDWIELLKSEGEYHEVHAKVDWDVELGTIARHVQSADRSQLRTTTNPIRLTNFLYIIPSHFDE